MPDAVATNPTGAGYFNLVQNGALILDVEIASTVSGNSPLGTVVEIEGYTGPGTGARSTPPTVQPSSTTGDNLVLGVIVGGQTNPDGGGTAIPPGGVAQVMVMGVAQVLCDATTVAGEYLVQSGATAGCAKTTGSPSTRAVGVCLQAVTISSGTALVWALVDPGSSSSPLGSGTQGAQGAQGTQGHQGFQGTQGTQGNQGAQGAQGA